MLRLPRRTYKAVMSRSFGYPFGAYLDGARQRNSSFYRGAIGRRAYFGGGCDDCLAHRRAGVQFVPCRVLYLAVSPRGFRGLPLVDRLGVQLRSLRRIWRR
jgi:hypothetical protein